MASEKWKTTQAFVTHGIFLLNSAALAITSGEKGCGAESSGTDGYCSRSCQSPSHCPWHLPLISLCTRGFFSWTCSLRVFSGLNRMLVLPILRCWGVNIPEAALNQWWTGGAELIPLPWHPCPWMGLLGAHPHCFLESSCRTEPQLPAGQSTCLCICFCFLPFSISPHHFPTGPSWESLPRSTAGPWIFVLACAWRDLLSEIFKPNNYTNIVSPIMISANEGKRRLLRQLLTNEGIGEGLPVEVAFELINLRHLWNKINQ